MGHLVVRTLWATGLGLSLGLAASSVQAQDKPAAKPVPAAKAVAQKDKATVPAKATADTATRPAAERGHEGMRYKSKDGTPCHSDKSADA